MKQPLFWGSHKPELLKEIVGWLESMQDELHNMASADHTVSRRIPGKPPCKPIHISSHGLDKILEQTCGFREPILSFCHACPKIDDMNSSATAEKALEGGLYAVAAAVELPPELCVYMDQVHVTLMVSHPACRMLLPSGV